MSSKISAIAAVVILSLFAMMVSDSRKTYTELSSVKSELSKINNQFTQYTDSIEKINLIEAELQQRLHDVKTENDRLYNNVITGIGKLQLNAKCPATPSTDSDTNAASARLNESAQRNYFLLRERIAQSELQINGLQQYINEVCLR